MATATVNQPEPAEHCPKYTFEPFVFSQKEIDGVSLPGSVFIQFVNLTHDVASGAQGLVELLEWDEMVEQRLEDGDTPETDPQPVLSPYHRANLRRFVSASLALLVAQCDRTTKWAYEIHTPEGRQVAAEHAAFMARSAK